MQLTLALLAILAQAKSPDRPLQGPAAKCGTEIPWVDTLDAAVAEAKKTGKPILWWVTDVAGSTMDRKLVVRKYMLSGPWMMPDVVSIVSTRFVPLRLAADGSMNVKPMVFIEPGLVVLDANLRELARVDRMSTFEETALRNWLRKHGKARGKTDEELFAEGSYESVKKPDARCLRRLGKDFKTEDLPIEEQALELLAKEDAAGAEKILQGATSEHARYLLGVAMHLQARDDEGRKVWTKLVEEKPDSRWAWKASAELARDGPFVRGFEVFAPPRKAEIATGVRYLLSMQRSHGGWDESNYNFGGDDSLPNVYMADTALIALALHEWKDADPRIAKALEKAGAYLRDESKIAKDDEDEIVWAYAYRLLYFTKIQDKEWMQAMVDALEKMQLRSGAFQHEYPNPFVTATVLHALWEAKQGGAKVPDATVKRAVDALKNCRGKNGVFSYGMGKGDRPEGGAGRTPLCELALVLWGGSTLEALKGAVELSFKHHDLLERVRKYDDHSDQYRNGGFFFWYDVHSRAEAIARLKDKGAGDRLVKTIWAIAEPDGAWVDSHELGRPYGTAMALLSLKRLGAK